MGEKDHFVFGDGKIAKGPGLSFHGALPMQGGYGTTVYAPDVKLEALQHAFHDVRGIVDHHGCLAVQNFDVHVIQGGAGDSYMSMHLSILGVSVLLALVMVWSSCGSGTNSFWE
jgi:hypothetical protein